MTSDRRAILQGACASPRQDRVPSRPQHVDCVVLDLSSGGARLKVGEWLGLPETFELRIESGPVHEVKVRYRDMETTGVEFVDRRAA